MGKKTIDTDYNYRNSGWTDLGHTGYAIRNIKTKKFLGSRDKWVLNLEHAKQTKSKPKVIPPGCIIHDIHQYIDLRIWP